MKKMIAGWLVVVGLLGVSVSGAALETLERPEYGGVVLEEVGEGSVLAEAGLQTNDLLLSWERLPNPPGNPDGTRGRLNSPFDWMSLEVEQAPRGKIRLSGVRQGESKRWTVALGLWKVKVRPKMPQPMMDYYLNGLKLIEEQQFVEGIDALRQAVEVANKNRDWRLQCWFSLRMGKAWAKTRAWEDTQASYRRALEQARDPLSQAVIWEAIGEAFLLQNEFDQARDAFRSALTIQDETWGKSLSVARSEDDLGNIARFGGDLATAEIHYQQALDLREKMAPESLDLAASFNNLGTVAALRGDLATAEAHYDRALALREKLAPESLDLATSLNNLGNVAAFRGDLATAEAYYSRVLALREKLAPESLDLAISYNNLANVAVHRGDLITAEAYHQRALILREKLAPNSLAMADSYNNLGVLRETLSDLAAAGTYYQRALAIWKKLAPNSLPLATALSNLGSVAVLRGDLTAAETFYHDAVTIRKKAAPNSLELATSFNNYGILARRRGDLSAAEEYHRRALAIRKKLAPDSTEVAASFTNLGNVFKERDDLVAADAYHQRALAIWENLAPDSPGMAAVLHNLGIVALNRGDLIMAESYQQRALTIRKNLAPESLSMAMSLNSLGNIAEARGDLLEAVANQQRALAIWQNLAPKSTGEAKLLHALGILFRKDDRPRQAADFLGRSLAALEGQIRTLGGSHELQGSFRTRYREFYRDTIEVLLEADRHEEALHTLERSRARSLLAMLAERDLVFAADLPAEPETERRRLGVRYDRALKKMETLSQTGPKKKVEALQDEIEALYRERDKLVARIRREYPKLAVLQYPQPLGAAQIKELLDPGTALLSYSIGEEQTDLFVVTRDEDLEVHSLPYGEAELRRYVTGFLGALERAKDPRHELFKGVKESGQKLYDILIRPVSDTLETRDRLLILPDGPLHNLPFGALVRFTDGADSDPERDWQYLAEWKPTHYALSATVYAELKNARRPLKDGASPLLAAFGDPAYGTKPTEELNSREMADLRVRSAIQRGLFNWNPLPYTRQEVLRIAGMHKNVQTYLGEGATEEQVKSIGRDVRILHFATHGYLDDRFPLNSALVFTLPSGFSEDRDNGLLQVWEIFESVRIDADLVVMSACQSAIGEEQGGEGLIGLTRAFQYAGARTVAATLWSVNDRAAAELMIRFYRHLRSGLPKDEALRAAQLELIRGPIEITDKNGKRLELDASAPYYWAAFQVFGDWQ